MKRKVLLIFFLIINVLAFAQDRQDSKVLFSGTIFGYHFDPNKKLIKNKEIELQGAIGSVQIDVYSGKNKVISTKSKSNGDFALYLSTEEELKFEISKKGYASSLFLIDMSSAPEEIRKGGLLFLDAELILNSFVPKKEVPLEPFGKLLYSTTTKSINFDSKSYQKKKKIFGGKEDNTPVNLMNSSVSKNIERNKGVNNEVVSGPSSETSLSNQNTDQDVSDNNENGTPGTSTYILSSDLNLSNLSQLDLDAREKEINKAWEQLEKDKLIAVTPEDFLLIQARENLLIAAEKELEDAKLYIDLQEKEISAQNTKLIWLYALLFIIIVFAIYVWVSMKNKSKLNRELQIKNKKITTSINYANRIQESILLDESDIKSILPNSFVFYKPLDIVSGDFYWFSEVDSKIIVAAVDCTGHGVPGAFMSLIGNTLLNEIINEKRILDPSKVLAHLHEGMIKSLRQTESDQYNQDGMDMSICVIDAKSKTIEFSGAMNPIFIVEDSNLKILEANLRGVGGVSRRKKAELPFEKEVYSYQSGVSVFLTSDGFLDQFGGSKNEKFNLPRFKDLVLNLSKQDSSDQLKRIEKAFTDWKGNCDQVDDVTVIGLKL